MKKVRKKKCSVCGDSFTPQRTSLQKVCGYKCAITYGKVKEARKQQGLAKMRNEKVNKDSLSKQIEYTKTKVHQYIRERDKGKPCISCKRNWDSSFQAGHRYSGNQHNGIRFDLDNIHGQCPKCNMYMEGNYNAYEQFLPGRIGEERTEALRKRADIALRVPKTWTRTELKEIQQRVKELKKDLKN